MAKLRAAKSAPTVTLFRLAAIPTTPPAVAPNPPITAFRRVADTVAAFRPVVAAAAPSATCSPERNPIAPANVIVLFNAINAT